MERRLAAILAADMVGYSRLMATDEAGTLRRHKAHHSELIDPKITEYGGRVVKTTGDGVLVEFPSVVDALRCAVTIQLAMPEREGAVPEEKRIAYRIGINLGDIIVEDNDIYGDGVNVTARLEALAEPGGICVSRTVVDHVKGKVSSDFDDLGEQSVKNIPEPVHVFRVLMMPEEAGEAVVEVSSAKWWQRPVAAIALGGTVSLIAAIGIMVWQPWTPVLEVASVDSMAFPLPDKPSLAVLPFENLSDDPEQNFLVDGITENIITDLSRFTGLFVIARHSVFTYKGKPVKIQQVAEDLGVQYVLEGSVQRSADRLRINAQLIDALTGKHVWAERYDKDMSDIFAVQDEVVQEIVSALGGSQGELAEAATKRVKRKGTANLSAYETFLIGVEHKHRFRKEDNAIAQRLFKQAINLDRQFAPAYVSLAWTHFLAYLYGWTESPAQSLEYAVQAAQAALELDSSDAEAHWVMADLHNSKGQDEKAMAEFNKALALNPNNADVLMDWGWNLSLWGRAEEGIAAIEKAMRLNPQHPEWYERGLGVATYTARHYEDAIAALNKVKEHVRISRAYLAASYAQLNLIAEATAEMDETLKLDPDATVESIISLQPYRNSADRDHFRDGLRKAGLPLCATETWLAKSPDTDRLEACDTQRGSG